MQSSIPADELSGAVEGTEAASEGAARVFKVMVIDDSKTIRRTAETLLKKEGFEP